MAYVALSHVKQLKNLIAFKPVSVTGQPEMFARSQPLVTDIYTAQTCHSTLCQPQVHKNERELWLGCVIPSHQIQSELEQVLEKERHDQKVLVRH